MISRLSRKMTVARRSESGFTLIELLVVIIILGVLSAVVVFAVQGTGDKGAAAASKIDARTLKTAEESFKARPGGTGSYGTEAELVSAGLLSQASTLHDVLLIGDPGPNQSYRITCNPTTNLGCGADGAAPVGGTIRVSGGNGAAVSGTNFLNPAVTSGGGVHPNVEYMFNGLMRWADNNTSQPDLAQSYTISPDQKTYTFTLRSGMTWHDGSPILPTDVKFTFEEALLKFHGRTSASIGAALGVTGSGSAATTPVGAITTTATDVVFHFNYGYAPLLKQLNVTEAPIIPQVVYGPCRYDGAGAGTDNIDATTCGPNNPSGAADLTTPAGSLSAPYGTGTGQVRHIGSGPFMLKSRNTTTGALVFVKFPGYHFAGLPLANEVDQVPTTDVANALIANSIDVGSPANNRILPIVSPQTTADITPANGYTLTQPPRGAGGGNCILTEAFNLWAKNTTPATINALPTNATYTHPIFGDPTVIPPNAGAGRPNAMSRGLVVRTALHMATDRQSLFNANQFGKGRLATSPYYSLVPGYTPTPLPGDGLTYAAAAARAGQWLEDAGWHDDGSAVRVNNTGNPAAPATLTFGMIAGTGGQNTYRLSIATQWAAAPIKVALGDNGFPSGDANGNFGAHAANRDYDMLTVSYCNGDDPVIGVRRQYYAATSASPTAGSQISGTAFTNSAGYRTSTMDTLWDQAAQSGAPATHAGIQAEAAANVPHIWLDESLGSRAWRTAKCAGFNNMNTGLFVETASCAA